MPSGIASFPGILQIVDATYTRAHGVQPGVAMLTIAPQPAIVGELGNLVFSFAGTSQNGNKTYVFSGCKLDRIHFERDDRGLIVKLAVFDRRWRWEFPTVTGTYNMRHENGELVKDLSATQSGQTAQLIWNTEKTPQELATLCLKAMGEANFDVSQLPNDARPLVEWDYDNAARALEELCELLGCRVVLKMDDTVQIWRVGIGADLPENLDIRTRSPGIDLPERPDTIRIIGNRQRVQADVLLEAVGLDTDGQTKLIDKLSYIPKNAAGFPDYSGVIPPYFLGIKDLKARELAKQTLWRWYRVKLPFTVAVLDNPDAESDPVAQFLTIDDLMQITPLEDMQVDMEIENGQKRFKPAWIWGVWGTDSLGYVNGVSTLQTLNPNFMVGELQVAQPLLGTAADFAKKTLYMGGFSIDKDRCIVKFSEIVAYVGSKQDSSGNTYKPVSAAYLYLRTALCIRSKTTRGWLRYNKRRDFGTDFGTQPYDIKREDVILNVALRYDPKYSFNPASGGSPAIPNIIGADTNFSDASTACDYYLDVAAQQFQTPTPEIRTYTGFQAVDLDGAIQQVTFHLSEAGAETTIARNTEVIVNRMSYNERRFYARMRRLRETMTTSQQQQARNARRRFVL